MLLTTSNRSIDDKSYSPPPLGNGDLQLFIDYQGSMEQTEYRLITPGIRRAGIRYDSPTFPLVPFGYFRLRPEGDDAPVRWTQSLDTREAFVTSEAEYADGTVVRSESFCCLTQNIIVLRRRIDGPRKLRVEYHLDAKRMERTGTPETGLSYRIDGLTQDKGTIHFFADQALVFSGGGTSWTATTPEREICLYLCFGDEEAAHARKQGFEGLFREHCEAWDAFHNEGFVNLPSESIQQVYESSIYHLRITSTRWSLPTGLFDTYWQGHYFAFDESIAGRGFLSAGHFNCTRKITEFRKAQLEAALERVSGYCKGNGAARYVWETIEVPGLEGAPGGHWLDHYFHMAMVARMAWDNYDYSGDLDFLRDTAYPVIRACAEFHRLQACYDHAGVITIGKCCDLERLGPMRENPFLTSCGAIANFEIAARAAKILDVDSELIPVWLRFARGLRKSLPNDGTKYLPYPGCPERSIAVLGGLVPFPVLPRDDPLQIAAVEDFLTNGRESAGNMYPLGKSVCTWYAVWMAIAHLRMGRPGQTLSMLEETAKDTGCFSEIFEIHEVGMRPWFTTGEGLFVGAVNELLLSKGIPEWQDAVYRLPHRMTAE